MAIVKGKTEHCRELGDLLLECICQMNLDDVLKMIGLLTNTYSTTKADAIGHSIPSVLVEIHRVDEYI